MIEHLIYCVKPEEKVKCLFNVKDYITHNALMKSEVAMFGKVRWKLMFPTNYNLVSTWW